MNLLDCLYAPAAVLTAPWWMRKQRSGWDERFAREGAIAVPAAAPGVKRVLLHAVSVGEVNSLRGLVPMLARRAEVVVSVSTDTGIARANALWPGSDARDEDAEDGVHPVRVVRYPLDFSGAVRRFLNVVRPDAVGLVELELWPNFIGECSRRDVPVCVINGRLSARSFGNYRKVRRLLRSTFESLAFAAVQDGEYAERFRHMGVAAERVRVTGSMKWDSVSVSREGEAASPVAGAEELRGSLGIDGARPLVVAGSTGPLREGCEEAVLDRAVARDVQLLCAPRKVERFEEAFKALGGAEGCVRRSECQGVLGRIGEQPGAKVNRYLLDTIGELRAAYSLADVCVVGRSFGALYGSDPIEPVSLGKATIIGPSHSDFASIVRTLQGAGGIVVRTTEDLPSSIRNLLSNADRRKELGERGLACIRANQGATARHAAMLLELAGVGNEPAAEVESAAGAGAGAGLRSAG